MLVFALALGSVAVQIDVGLFASVSILTLHPGRALLLNQRLSKPATILRGSLPRDVPCESATPRNACSLTHLRALRALRGRSGWHLILEDDAIESGWVAQTPDWAERVFASAGPEALMINFGPGAFRPSVSQVMSRPIESAYGWIKTRLFARSGFTVLHGMGSYAHAYAIREPAVELITSALEQSLCSITAIDLHYNSLTEHWVKQVHLHQFTPEWLGVTVNQSRAGLFSQSLHISDVPY